VEVNIIVCHGRQCRCCCCRLGRCDQQLIEEMRSKKASLANCDSIVPPPGRCCSIAHLVRTPGRSSGKSPRRTPGKSPARTQGKSPGRTPAKSPRCQRHSERSGPPHKLLMLGGPPSSSSSTGCSGCNCSELLKRLQTTMNEPPSVSVDCLSTHHSTAFSSLYRSIKTELPLIVESTASFDEAIVIDSDDSDDDLSQPQHDCTSQSVGQENEASNCTAVDPLNISIKVSLPLPEKLATTDCCPSSRQTRQRNSSNQSVRSQPTRSSKRLRKCVDVASTDEEEVTTDNSTQIVPSTCASDGAADVRLEMIAESASVSNCLTVKQTEVDDVGITTEPVHDKKLSAADEVTDSSVESDASLVMISDADVTGDLEPDYVAGSVAMTTDDAPADHVEEHGKQSQVGAIEKKACRMSEIELIHAKELSAVDEVTNSSVEPDVNLVMISNADVTGDVEPDDVTGSVAMTTDDVPADHMVKHGKQSQIGACQMSEIILVHDKELSAVEEVTDSSMEPNASFVMISDADVAVDVEPKEVAGSVAMTTDDAPADDLVEHGEQSPRLAPEAQIGAVKEKECRTSDIDKPLLDETGVCETGEVEAVSAGERCSSSAVESVQTSTLHSEDAEINPPQNSEVGPPPLPADCNDTDLSTVLNHSNEVPPSPCERLYSPLKKKSDKASSPLRRKAIKNLVRKIKKASPNRQFYRRSVTMSARKRFKKSPPKCIKRRRAGLRERLQPQTEASTLQASAEDVCSINEVKSLAPMEDDKCTEMELVLTNVERDAPAAVPEPAHQVTA